MTILILGILLWVAGHFFKRALPGVHGGLGNAAKGVSAAVILAGLVLMVIGYRGAVTGFAYVSPPWTIHLNNLLMLLAVYLYAASGTRARLATKMRHPQLTAVKTWAVAHLLVNGDWASIVLFGSLLAWAVAEVIVINRSQPDWTPPEWGGPSAEIKAVVGTIIVFAVIAGIHIWLGYWPFPA
jgi:uncharacterized membrane protein